MERPGSDWPHRTTNGRSPPGAGPAESGLSGPVRPAGRPGGGTAKAACLSWRTELVPLDSPGVLTGPTRTVPGAPSTA